MRCVDCGTEVHHIGQLHYPGNDPENGPAHAATDIRLCWHCGEPARDDGDYCQFHYELFCEQRRAMPKCPACTVGYHDMCEGCQCMEVDCDPWVYNDIIDWMLQAQGDVNNDNVAHQ
jgi:hypothetical protein